MNENGAGPVIGWLYSTLSGLAQERGVAWLPGVLVLCYLLLGFALALITAVPRSRTVAAADRVLQLRAGSRRIRQANPRDARRRLELNRRLFADAGVRRGALAWPAVYLLLLLLGLWAGVGPWADKYFRRGVGQAEPTLAGRPIDVPFAIGADPIVTTCWALWLCVAAGALAAALRWSINRVRALRSARPRGALLSFVASALVIWLVTGVLVPGSGLTLPWMTIVLACVLGPSLVAHARVARRRRIRPVEWPEWLLRPVPEPDPAPSAGATLRTPGALERLPAPIRSGAGSRTAAPPRTVEDQVGDPAPTRAFATAPAAAAAAPAPATAPADGPADAAAPTTVTDGASPTAATVLAAAPGSAQEQTAVLSAAARTILLPRPPAPVRPTEPDTWAALAPAIQPLAAYEPDVVGGWPVLGRIGTGGMAIVYLTRSGDTPMAIKVANPMAAAEMRASDRLLREIMALSRVGGESVVGIRDVGIDRQHPFIVMDYLAGPTLAQAVARLGPMRRPEQLRVLARSLARALARIHASDMSHRDLKPANVLLTERGPVVVDLGIARVTDNGAALTQVGTTLGSVGYLAPELQLSASQLDTANRADVWSWAACVAYAASGRPLFEGRAPATVLAAIVDERRDHAVMEALAGLDRDLAALVWDCTRVDPAARPADGAALLAQLPPLGQWGAPW